MASNGSHFVGFQETVLLRHHSRRALRAAAALAIALLGSFWARHASAEVDESQERAKDKPKVEVLLRASYAKLHIGLLQLGIEGTYMLKPRLGFGATLEAFYVDNGADPQYSAPGTLEGGRHALAFVEGDLLKGVFTPYARAGLGVGLYDRYQPTDASSGYAQPEPETDFVGQLSLGVALRLGPVLARASASPSLYGNDAIIVYGLGLGGRF
jgi:hypothetical protein